MEKKLAKKTAIYFIGNLSSKIMTAVLVPIYAFYVTAEDLGYYDFAQTFLSIATPIILFAMWEGILKHLLSSDDDFEKRKILTTASISVIVILILVTTFAVIVLFLFSELNFSNILIVLMMINYSLSIVWQYFTRGLGNSVLYVSSSIVAALINFVLIIFLVVFLKIGLNGLLISYSLTQFFVFALLENKLKILKAIKIKDFSIEIFKKIFLFSAPLVPNLISIWFITGFGRSLITIQLGSQSNGLYSFASKFSLIITMLGTVVSQAFIEEAILSAKKEKSKDKLGKSIQSLFEMFLQLALFSIPVINIFYIYIGKTEYSSSLQYVPFLLIYAVVSTMSTNVGALFQALEKTNFIFTTTIFGAIISIVVPVTLINHLGVFSVLIGQLLGAILMLTLRIFYVKKYIDLKIRWGQIIVYMVVYFILFIPYLQNSLLINILVVIVFTLYLFIIYREFIRSILNNVHHRFSKK